MMPEEIFVDLDYPATGDNRFSLKEKEHRQKYVLMIDQDERTFVKEGYVLLPKNKREAELMVLIGEKFLKECGHGN